jgi:hypothetical protein
LRDNAAAQGGQAETTTGAQDGEGEIGTGTGMRLVELDGSRRGPVDRGECKDLLTVRPAISSLGCWEY